MEAVRLAGITPTSTGYRIAPRYPFQRFSLRLPQIGIASEQRRMRGYVTSLRGRSLQVVVELPPGANRRGLRTWSGRRRVRHTVQGGSVTFTLATPAGRRAGWALRWGG